MKRMMNRANLYPVEKMWLQHWGTAIHKKTFATMWRHRTKRWTNRSPSMGPKRNSLTSRVSTSPLCDQQVEVLKTWPRLKSPILLTWKIWIASKCWKIKGGQNQHLGAPKQRLLHHESGLFLLKNVVFWGSFKTPHNQLREILWHQFWWWEISD